MIKKLIVIVTLCAFAALPAVAEMTVQETGVNPALVTTIHGTSPYLTTGAWTGVYQLKITGSPLSWLRDGTVDSFCIDICQYAPTGNPYSVISLDVAPQKWDPSIPGWTGMGSARAGYLATLLDKYWGSWIPDGTYTIDGTSCSGNEAAAALQLAVWEVVSEYQGQDLPANHAWTVSSGSGNFWAECSDGKVIPLANSMLSQITYTSPYDNCYRALSSDEQQDYVVRVPIPGAVLLGLLGLGAAGVKLRRFA